MRLIYIWCMKDITLTISSKGQITLPKRARDKLGVRAGSKLVLERVGKRELVLSVGRRPEDYYGALDGLWEGGGQSVEGYVRGLRDQDE